MHLNTGFVSETCSRRDCVNFCHLGEMASLWNRLNYAYYRQRHCKPTERAIRDIISSRTPARGILAKERSTRDPDFDATGIYFAGTHLGKQTSIQEDEH